MPIPILRQEQYCLWDIVDVVRTLGYKFISVSGDVYTFLDGEEKIGDTTYVIVDMVQKEAYKMRHVYWGEWKHLKLQLPEEHEEVIQKLFKKY